MDLNFVKGTSSYGVVGSNPGERLFFWLDLFCSAVTEFMGLLPRVLEEGEQEGELAG